MENIKSCELCLKQIIKSENFENLHCDEKRNLKILKNLDIIVSKDAKICSNCVNISHLTYNFKMSCLTNNEHLKTLIHPGINEKLILEEVVVEETKSEFKHETKVCRFCLNFSEVNSLVEVNQEQDVVLKDMLRRCLPEIDTNIVQNPLICSICSELLEKLFNFFSQCEDTEVLRNLDTKTDILVNENIATVTVKNNDDNIDNGFVKEEICEGIKNSELQIKSEDFDIGEHIKDSINESNCLLNEKEIQKGPSSFSSDLFSNPVDEKDVKSKPHGTIKEKKFVCDICSYQTNINDVLKRHCLIHKKPSEVNVFKCDDCPFATKWKNNLNMHAIRHKNPSELPKFKCYDCTYETNNRNYLVQHVRVHKLLEVNRFKCDYCPFATANKRSLMDHAIRHKNPSELPKFKCNDCPYETHNKNYLIKHVRLHKLLEVNGFKCDYCPFATANKQSLIEHAIRHKNPSELPKFKCNDCRYETHNRKYLIKHVLVHKNASQVNMYKCNVCSYQTKYKYCSLVHKKQHQVEIYTCDKCNYKSKFKRSLMFHLRYHRKWKQPAESSRNLKELRQYKCNECSYVGIRKSSLIRHQMIHKDPSEREKYNCMECSFQTLYKSYLKIHYKKNHSNSKIPFGELKTSM